MPFDGGRLFFALLYINKFGILFSLFFLHCLFVLPFWFHFFDNTPGDPGVVVE